jgi:hypothetical protein
MSNLSLLLDTKNEGKPSGWRYWWDRAATPSKSRSPPTKGEEEGASLATIARTRRRRRRRVQTQGGHG